MVPLVDLILNPADRRAAKLYRGGEASLPDPLVQCGLAQAGQLLDGGEAKEAYRVGIHKRSCQFVLGAHASSLPMGWRVSTVTR